ncbi:MAG: trypsin-like peptidase domain-containing protein [Bacteroidales bacterium]|nr:MAG: trypsin-like peptidase domain-containing protein [Bacteroidales bacterium]
MYKIIFTVFFLLLNALFAPAQIQYKGKPLKLYYPGSKDIPVINLTVPELYKVSKVDKAGQPSRLKPDEFARAIITNYDYQNYGVWDTLENDTKIWRFGISSEDAYSLNIIFNEYRVSDGVKVFIYDDEQKYILGALTYRNNKPGRILATTPIPGDIIYIEMQVPSYIKNPGLLKIARVGIGYKELSEGTRLKDEWYGASEPCNMDINCMDNSEIQKLKYSVCRIIYLGNERCTGTLINNTGNSGRPLVLTAQHCLSTDYIAETAIFYFDYESPYCNGPDGNSLKSISGSSLVATTANNLDFALVELTAEPPFNYKPFFSGWNNTNIPPDNSFSIHHPRGDVKKIAVDNDQATTDDYGEGYDVNTHWLISDWETGTTEKGSSGAPLFNQDGELIGTLTGGDANCQLSVNDYYQKLYHSWEDYQDREQQLKYWLDPLDSGAEILDGYDPFESVWETGDTISNIDEGEDLTLIKANLDWGYLSGHNSLFIEFFAEKFNVPGRKNLFGLFMNVAKLYNFRASSKITVILWDGDSEPDREVYNKEVLYTDLTEDDLNFVEFDSAVIVDNTFFLGYQVKYYNPADTFALYMRESNSGTNTAFIYTDSSWESIYMYSGAGISTAFDIRPLIFDSISSPFEYDTTLSTGDIKIVPVTGRNVVEIELYEWPEEEVIVNIYSLSGQLITSKLYNYSDKIIEHKVNNLGNGIYLIQVLYKRFVVSEKLPVFR